MLVVYNTFTRTLLLSNTTSIYFLKPNSISVSQQSQHFYVLMGVFDKPFSHVCHAINPFTGNHLNSFSDVVLYIYVFQCATWKSGIRITCGRAFEQVYTLPTWRAFAEGNTDRHQRRQETVKVNKTWMYTYILCWEAFVRWKTILPWQKLCRYLHSYIHGCRFWSTIQI